MSAEMQCIHPSPIYVTCHEVDFDMLMESKDPHALGVRGDILGAPQEAAIADTVMANNA